MALGLIAAALLGFWLMAAHLDRTYVGAMLAGSCGEPDGPPECHRPAGHAPGPHRW
jgi:hypothetical protein